MVEEVSNVETLAILDGLSEAEFVLHGSPVESRLLKPHLPLQDHNLIEEYCRKAVHGTLMTEIALLYAVVRESTNVWGWQIDLEKSPHFFIVGPARIQISAGFVHICRRRSFPVTVPPGLVCLSTRQVKPTRVLRVQPNILEILIDSGRLAFR